MPYIKSGALAALTLTRKGFHRQWRAALIKDEPVPPYTLEFIKLLANHSMPALKDARRQSRASASKAVTA
jgi:hypothetical protein